MPVYREMPPQNAYEVFLFVIFRGIFGLFVGSALVAMLTMSMISGVEDLSLFEGSFLLIFWLFAVGICAIFPYPLLHALLIIVFFFTATNPYSAKDNDPNA